MLLIGTVISCEESLAPVHKQNNVWDVLLVFFFVIISLIWMNVCLAMDLRLELRVFRETHSPDSCWTIQVPHFSHEGLHYSAGTRFPLVENTWYRLLSLRLRCRHLYTILSQICTTGRSCSIEEMVGY